MFVRLVVFFFFQAEDGIRDLTVTGVQTCALPISVRSLPWSCSTEFIRAPATTGRPRSAAASGARNTTCASPPDRKSTRLNSSHSQTSYAVFFLQKKNQHDIPYVSIPDAPTHRKST